MNGFMVVKTDGIDSVEGVLFVPAEAWDVSQSAGVLVIERRLGTKADGSTDLRLEMLVPARKVIEITRVADIGESLTEDLLDTGHLVPEETEEDKPGVALNGEPFWVRLSIGQVEQVPGFAVYKGI